VRNEGEFDEKESVEASEIAAFSAIGSGSLRRAIPDVSTALLRMTFSKNDFQFRKDDGRRFPAYSHAGSIDPKPVTQRAGHRLGVFWGLWLLPFGMLVMRSRFLPRILGVLLILNCVGYVAASATTLLVPSYSAAVSRAVMPTLLGELWVMLWLLIKGARKVTLGAA